VTEPKRFVYILKSTQRARPVLCRRYVQPGREAGGPQCGPFGTHRGASTVENARRHRIWRRRTGTRVWAVPEDRLRPWILSPALPPNRYDKEATLRKTTGTVVPSVKTTAHQLDRARHKFSESHFEGEAPNGSQPTLVISRTRKSGGYYISCRCGRVWRSTDRRGC